MIPTYRNLLRAAALATSLCVAQVYVFAGPVVTPNAPEPQTGGTLKTTDNKPVLVNGNKVGGGTTVLPNSAIETPEGVTATVQLGFAEVIISAGSDITLDFTPGTDVTVTLRRGCVVIKTTGEARGTIVKPDGTTVATGTDRVANACDREGGVPVVGTAGVGGISKGVLAVLFISAGAVTFAALTLAGRGFNPSPSNP